MNVKMLREKHGWTQKDMATYVGVSVSTIQSWEQNKQGSENSLRNPSKRHLEKLRKLV